MISFPNAKVNLGLNILNKREDGFHNIETLFFPIKDLTDSLEIIPNGESSHNFTSSGISIDGDPSNNLVMKAVALIELEHNIPSLDIHLHKHIPLGAGLGGGSADATFTLIALNKMFKLGISDNRLEELAAILGSDCPLFVKNEPMLGSGRGEILIATPLSLSGYKMVLVKPNVSVGTAEAYSGVTPQEPEIRVADILKTPIEQWQGVLQNDFEDSIFPNHSQLHSIKEQLLELGAVYASMSGSGSTIFGIFHSSTATQEILSNFKSDSNFVWVSEL